MMPRGEMVQHKWLVYSKNKKSAFCLLNISFKVSFAEPTPKTDFMTENICIHTFYNVKNLEIMLERFINMNER
jgi:hypothetical protein